MRKYFWLAWISFLLLSSCSFTQKIQTGQQAFDVKQYSVAAQLFEKEFEESHIPKEKARLAFYAGESYRNLNNFVSAGQWHLKASKEGYGDESLLQYADALKHQEKYEEASLVYEDLLKSNPGNAAYRSNLTLIKQAIDWIRNSNTAYDIEPVAFNSPGNDYSPQPVGPGQVIFTSDRSSKQSSDTYLWTGRAYSDIFISSLNSSASQVAEYDGSINTDDNEGTAVISPDGKMLAFTRCYVGGSYDAWCKLMMSFRQNDEWTEPQPFPFVKEKINYGQPAFTTNGSTLFFSSDAPEGQGGHDLYYTQPDGKGGWTEPVNLGPMINTLGEEQYPTVYKDTLFFSSDHLAGLGGLDIFKTYLDVRNQWVPPINLRAPINSGNDDFGFVVDTFNKPGKGILMTGYFTSSREGPGRNDEIYSFSLSGIAKDTNVVAVVETKKKEEKSIDQKLFVVIRVMEPDYEVKDDPNSRKLGKRPLPNGPVIQSIDLTDERFVTDESGQILLKLDWNTNYVFTARYRDHLADTYTLNTAEVKRDSLNPITTVNHTMVLEPVFKNKEIVLENIFYDYDQSVIREDAKPSLNNLANTMKTNPAIKIQLSSHTDCRGTDEYNLDLSQKRAQAAVDYLQSTGIPSSRLLAQGYGESNPAVICECEKCTEDQHQKNRRTTFKIID
ncbi:MAG TPA: OmpA family protein [Saprospiraceae bacterium]|nr:OmpA family protein [Saprospiraceae bacterium]